MPFLGRQPAVGFASIAKDDFTADGSTTAFTLSRVASNANDIAVFVGNVRQEPTDAYSVSGTTLTMTAAPSSGTNFYVLHLAGGIASSTVPAAGTTVPGDFGLTGTLSVDTIDVSTGSRVEFNEALYTGDADGFRVGNIQLSRKDAYSTTDSYFAGSLPASGGSAPFNNYDHVVVNAKSGRQIYFGTGGSERLRITDSGLSFDSGSNHLDDYEEGTWNPVVAFNGASAGITYSGQRGTYVKIGSFVYCWFDVVLSSKGTSTGGMQIRNLPFTATDGVEGRGSFVATYFDSFTGLNSSLVGRVESNSNYFPVSQTNGTSSITALTDISNSNATNSSRLQGLVTMYSNT